jgi:hypothetical protein
MHGQRAQICGYDENSRPTKGKFPCRPYTSQVPHFIYINMYGGALQNAIADLKLQPKTPEFLIVF